MYLYNSVNLESQTLSPLFRPDLCSETLSVPFSLTSTSVSFTCFILSQSLPYNSVWLDVPTRLVTWLFLHVPFGRLLPFSSPFHCHYCVRLFRSFCSWLQRPKSALSIKSSRIYCCQIPSYPFRWFILLNLSGILYSFTCITDFGDPTLCFRPPYYSFYDCRATPWDL